MGFLFRAHLPLCCKTLQRLRIRSSVLRVFILVACQRKNGAHTDGMKNTARGFSLIEIMIVIVMIAMLSSGGIYGFQQWQQHQQLWQITHQLSQFLHYLRSDANAYNRDHLLTFHQQHKGWCFTSQPYGHLPCEATSQWQFIPRFKDVSMVEMTHGLGFYGVMNTAKPGHIIVSNPAGKRKIIISVWGRIRSCSLTSHNQCE